MYYLQNRWKYEDNALYYYGLRNKENLFNNKLKLSKKQRAIVSSLPKELSENEKKLIGNLIGVQVVKENDLFKIPGNLSEAVYCKSCCANNFIGSACIRCMKCVTDCPNKALSFKNSLILNAYLKKKRSKKQIELFL